MDEQKHLKNEQGEPGNKTEKSEYLFMQETIKDENSRGKKYRKDLLRIAGLGVAFGVCACISFSALRPWLDEKFPGDSQEVVIPEEKEEEKSDETTADTGNDSTVQTLGIDSYRELQKAMNSVASEAAKSVVEVIGISGEQDWTEESYDNKNSVSGLIIADNGQELLIYGKTSILRDTKEIHIRFADGTTKQASVKKKDESLGFAIYAVAKSSQHGSRSVLQLLAVPVRYRKEMLRWFSENRSVMRERLDLERLRAAEMNWTVMTEVIRFFVQTLVRQRTGQV